MRNLIFVFGFFAKRLRSRMSRDLFSEVCGGIDKEVATAHRWIEDIELECFAPERIIFRSRCPGLFHSVMPFNFREKWSDCLLDDVFNNVIWRVIRPGFAAFCFVGY